MKALGLFVTLLTASCATGLVAPIQAPQPRADWSAVEAVLGRSGVAQPGNVHNSGSPAAISTCASAIFD